MPTRKYQVSGADDLGDIHLFLTDAHERAEQVAELMREDLVEVELTEH
jgi:hypothetical protein